MTRNWTCSAGGDVAVLQLPAGLQTGVDSCFGCRVDHRCEHDRMGDPPPARNGAPVMSRWADWLERFMVTWTVCHGRHPTLCLAF
jgi:hypothetical protein